MPNQRSKQFDWLVLFSHKCDCANKNFQPPSFHDEVKMAERSSLVDVTFEGLTLQLQPNQLTISTLAVVFRLIPDTIFLVLSCGTVAIAEEGLFRDVDSDYSWTVEGDKSIVNWPSSYQQPSGSRTAVLYEHEVWPNIANMYMLDLIDYSVLLTTKTLVQTYSHWYTYAMLHSVKWN